MNARNFLDPGEKIIVFYTEGELLEFPDDNTALTGDWGIDPSHSIDRVIIYWCFYPDKYSRINKLYIGNHAGVEFVEQKKLYKVKLAHVQYIGLTKLNWFQFADTGSCPIRYLP